MASEPVEDDLEAHDSVGRRPGARELVSFGREADELDLPPYKSQHREEVLALLDVSAKIVLGMEDQERRLDVRRVRRRRQVEMRVDVLERKCADEALEPPVEIARAERRDE